MYKHIKIIISTILLLTYAGSHLYASNNQTDSVLSPAIPATFYYGNHWNHEHVRIGKIPAPQNELCLTLLNKKCATFICPVNGPVISPYGKRGNRTHTGTDIKLRLGDTVVAAFDGVVRMAKTYSGYGLIVVIRHENGLESAYSHLSKILVDIDQPVRAGEPIGLGGRTGRATTEHLHFELRFLGEPFNPEMVINFSEKKLKTNALYYKNGTFVIDQTDNQNVGNHEIEIIEDIPEEEIADINTTTVKKDTLSSAVKPDPKTTNNTKPSGAKTTNHVVKKGETVFSIAKLYGVDIKDIQKWNNIGKNYGIKVGQKLIIKK